MIKLHIGCGKRNFGNDWIHIDGNKYDHVQFINATELSFDTNSVDLIYASHLIAYFNRDEIKNVLKEWHRVLKPNGILRIATPDFNAMVKLYISQNLILTELLGPLYGKWDLNGEIYHKTAYDFESLSNVLYSIGFSGICKYDWRTTGHASFDDHSQAYIPHMDKEKGTLISLNIECQKI